MEQGDKEIYLHPHSTESMAFGHVHRPIDQYSFPALIWDFYLVLMDYIRKANQITLLISTCWHDLT